MVEDPDGRLRPEERNDALLDERAQDEHVLALIELEAAAAVEADEADDGRKREDEAEPEDGGEPLARRRRGARVQRLAEAPDRTGPPFV